MKTMLTLMTILGLIFLVVSCTGTPIPSPTTTPPTTPPYTTTPPVTTTPTPSPTVTFDFDAGLPVPSLGQNTPFDQTSSGLKAHFGSPSDPAAFSVQSYDTTFFTLPQFSGKYLNQNKRSMTKLDISFSRPLTSITLTFATMDYHGVGEVEEPTAIKLTAYMNTIETAPVGSVMARGTFPANYTFPQGTLSLDSGGKPFNLAVVELIYQPRGGTNFLVDNITVT